MTVGYIESSALVKLAIAEPETRALRDALLGHERLTASELSAIEATRAAWRRDGHAGAARARAAVLRIGLIPIDRPIVDTATRVTPPSLRSIDAIHLATALSIGIDDVVFYSYDRRTIEAATMLGVVVASPGAG